MVEEVATKNDVMEEVAMDNMSNEDGKHAWTSSSQVLETWVMVDEDISVNGERTITEEIGPNQS